MKYVLDMHTHTLASGHAYNTITEMARAAADKGLAALGITEHGPAVESSCRELYFVNLCVVPREMFGLRLFMGAEMNITDTDGTLDLNENVRKTLDVRMAGMHYGYYAMGSKRENTRAYIRALTAPCVDVITHPDDDRFPVDYGDLVKAARDAHVLLEINNGSLRATGVRNPEGCRRNMLEMLALCEKHRVSVILGSDAHVAQHIAAFDYAERVLGACGFPDALIVNRSVEALQAYLR